MSIAIPAASISPADGWLYCTKLHELVQDLPEELEITPIDRGHFTDVFGEGIIEEYFCGKPGGSLTVETRSLDGKLSQRIWYTFYGSTFEINPDFITHDSLCSMVGHDTDRCSIRLLNAKGRGGAMRVLATIHSVQKKLYEELLRALLQDEVLLQALRASWPPHA